MPPSQKRARRYDPVRTRTAVLAQFAHVRGAVRTLTPEQLALPTRLGDWTVRELAAHLTMALSGVTRNLELPEPAAAKPGLTPVQWPFATADRAAGIADDTGQLALDRPDLDALYEEVAARFEELVPGVGDERLLTTRVGVMRLADFLVTRTVELVVHTDDLNEAAWPRHPVRPPGARRLHPAARRRPRGEGAGRLGRGADPAVRRRPVRIGPQAHPGHAAQRRGDRSAHLDPARHRAYGVGAGARRGEGRCQRGAGRSRRPAATDGVSGNRTPGRTVPGPCGIDGRP